MNVPEATRTKATLVQSAVNAAWPFVSGRRGLMVLAIGVAAGGLALNWGWLVAAGLAPVVLAVLPCAAMCALGLCMNKGRGEKPGSNEDVRGGPEGES